jgi:hypothetical protein
MTGPLPEGGAEAPPRAGPTAEELADALAVQVRVLWEQALRYMRIQADRGLALFTRLVILAILGLVVLVACMAVAVMTCWLVLSGAAGGLSEALGSVWLGRLAAGLGVIFGVAATALAVAWVRAARATRRARRKYETTASERESRIAAPASSHGA